MIGQKYPKSQKHSNFSVSVLSSPFLSFLLCSFLSSLIHRRGTRRMHVHEGAAFTVTALPPAGDGGGPLCSAADGGAFGGVASGDGGGCGCRATMLFVLCGQGFARLVPTRVAGRNEAHCAISKPFHDTADAPSSTCAFHCTYCTSCMPISDGRWAYFSSFKFSFYKCFQVLVRSSNNPPPPCPTNSPCLDLKFCHCQ